MTLVTFGISNPQGSFLSGWEEGGCCFYRGTKSVTLSQYEPLYKVKNWKFVKTGLQTCDTDTILCLCSNHVLSCFKFMLLPYGWALHAKSLDCVVGGLQESLSDPIQILLTRNIIIYNY